MFHGITSHRYGLAFAEPINLPSYQAFGRWLAVQRDSGSRGFTDPEELAAALKLAKARSAEIRNLMEKDPKEFLRLAMPAAERATLPFSMQTFIEKRIKGRGSFTVSCVLPTPVRQAGVSDKTSGLHFEARIDGVAYQAFVAGKWRSQRSVHEAELEGVSLGDAIVFGDSPSPNEREGAGGHVMPRTPDPSGPNTLLYMIGQFSDETNAPITEATALAQIGVVNTFWLNNSSGKVGLHGLMNPGQVMDIVHITLPHPRSYGPSYNANFDQLLTDARNAAAALGYNYLDYNLDAVVTSNQGFSYAGHAKLFDQGAHFVVPYTTLRTVGHEFGHNLGLYHANYWRTDALAPYGQDSTPGGYVSDIYEGEWLEYGHYFSLMGAQSGEEVEDPSKPYYAPVERAYLGWLSAGQIQYVSNSGTYRIFRLDHRNTLGIPRGIQIATPATDYTGNERKYWLSYRYAPWSIAQDWFRNGVQVDVANNGGYDYDGAILLDMTPYSKDSPDPFFDKNNKPGSWWTIDNSDKVDGALVVGRTYSDRAAGIHITPILTGSNGTYEEYIDVVINFGKFPLNRAPVITGFYAETNQIATGQPLNFTVTASDPDGDTLAYSWSFDEVQIWTQNGLNNASATKSWSNAGLYRVIVTVSDMKGGLATESMLVTVGVPANARQIWGRVLWAGQPVLGARLWSTVASTVYQAWTDITGSYVLTDLPLTNNYTLNCSQDGLTFSPQFVNPVSVASGNVFGTDFYANKSLPPPSSFAFTISGKVGYGANGVLGAEVRAGGRVALCDYSGNYQFSNLPAGDYSIVPQVGNWTFSPSNRMVALSSSDSFGNDFLREAPFFISGRIDGIPAGVSDPAPLVYLSNGHSMMGIRTSGATNYWTYLLTDVPFGQFNLSAELWQHRLLPSGFTNPLVITTSLSNINFTGSAAAVDGSLFGRVTELGVPLPDVNVEARKAGTAIASGMTDSDGYYRIINMTNGPYTIVPARAGYSFTPSAQDIATIYSAGYDFVATGSNSAPIITSLQAFPSIVPNRSSTSTFSVLASGNGAMTYHWDALSGRGPVVFNVNDSMNATSTVVSFQAPGDYTFRVRVTDVFGFCTMSNLNLSVTPLPATMVVAPYQSQTSVGSSVGYRADAWDELGGLLSVSPSWSTSGGGAVNSMGVYAATTPGPYQVRAVAGTLSATGLISVTSATRVPVLAINSLGNGSFLFQFDGLPGLVYRIEFTETLNQPVWQTLTSNAADQFGIFQFTETPPPTSRRRYYRVVYP